MYLIKFNKCTISRQFKPPKSIVSHGFTNMKTFHAIQNMEIFKYFWSQFKSYFGYFAATKLKKKKKNSSLIDKLNVAKVETNAE